MHALPLTQITFLTSYTSYLFLNASHTHTWQSLHNFLLHVSPFHQHSYHVPRHACSLNASIPFSEAHLTPSTYPLHPLFAPVSLHDSVSKSHHTCPVFKGFLSHYLPPHLPPRLLPKHIYLSPSFPVLAYLLPHLQIPSGVYCEGLPAGKNPPKALASAYSMRVEVTMETSSSSRQEYMSTVRVR